MDAERKQAVIDELGFDPETATWRQIERCLSGRMGRANAKSLMAHAGRLAKAEKARTVPVVERLKALAARH